MNTDWSNPVPKILGAREPSPRTIRFPVDLAADLKQLAKEQGQDFTTYVLCLLSGAVAEVKATHVTPHKKRAQLKRAG